MRRFIVVGLATFIILQSIYSAFAADEEGPVVISSRTSTNGPVNPGDTLIVYITMTDPGGSGIRNIQFILNDKFGRQKTSRNDSDFNSAAGFNCPGTNICEVPFKFEIDSTWGTDGYITFSNMTAYDKLTNGTYFYNDGKVQNLQSKTFYSGLMTLATLKIAIGNPPPSIDVNNSAAATTAAAAAASAAAAKAAADAKAAAAKAAAAKAAAAKAAADAKAAASAAAAKAAADREALITNSFAAEMNAVNAATDAANIAAEAVDSETSEFFDLLDSAAAKATLGIKTVLDIQKALKNTEERLIRLESMKLVAESESEDALKMSSDNSLPLQVQRTYSRAYNTWISSIRTINSSLSGVTGRLEIIKNSQDRINKVADEYLARQSVVSKTSEPIRNTTITCVKGKLSKRVTSAKPVCPSGYKKK